MIEIFQDELYRLENKQAKSAKLHANITWELQGKNAPKLFSKHLKDRICKIKHNLNYILMIIKQNALTNPKDIIKPTKSLMRSFTQRRQVPKLLLLNFLAKFLTEKKYIMNDLSLRGKKFFK